jgi:hypothetical protein
MREVRVAIPYLSITALRITAALCIAAALLLPGAGRVEAQSGIAGALPTEAAPPAKDAQSSDRPAQGTAQQPATPAAPATGRRPISQTPLGEMPIAEVVSQLQQYAATIEQRRKPQEQLFGNLDNARATLAAAFRSHGAAEWTLQIGYTSSWVPGLYWPGSLYSYHANAVQSSLSYATGHTSVPPDQWQAIVDGMRKWEEYEAKIPPLMAQKVDLVGQQAKAISDHQAAFNAYWECKEPACKQEQAAAQDAAQKKLDQIGATEGALNKKLQFADKARFFSALTDNPSNCVSMTLTYMPAALSSQSPTAAAQLAYAPANCEHAFGVPVFAIVASNGAKFHLDDNGDLTRDEDKAGSVTIQATHGPLAATATAEAAGPASAAAKKPVVASAEPGPANPDKPNSGSDNKGKSGSSGSNGAKSQDDSGADSSGDKSKSGGGNPSGGSQGASGDGKSGTGSQGASGGKPAAAGSGGGNQVASNSGGPNGAQPPGGPTASLACSAIGLTITPSSIHAAIPENREMAAAQVTYMPEKCQPPTGQPQYRVADLKIAEPVGVGSASFVGHAAGKTTITATQNNLSADATITVLARSECEHMTLAYTVDGAALTNGRKRLRPAIDYEPNYCNPPPGALFYSSSDPGIASVTEDGVVIALATGHVTITARRNNLSANAEISVP